MKLYLGSTPVTAYVHTDTDDTSIAASDMQSGMTAYARGAKITGTGKCFEFATYGTVNTNSNIYIPSRINTLIVTSTTYAVKLRSPIVDLRNFTTASSGATSNPLNVSVGYIYYNNTWVEFGVSVSDNYLKFVCTNNGTAINTTFQVFYGKDNHL